MRRKIMVSTLILLLVLVYGIPVEARERRQVDILFTHDLHSHLEEFKVQIDEAGQKVGGFARLKTVIEDKKQRFPETLIIDGGDFSMGTLYQTVFRDQAAELRMMGYLGFDATTLGNHEFDYRSQGLADMMNTAKGSGERLPELVLSNAQFQEEDSEQILLKETFESYGVKPYVMIEKAGVKIAIMGVFGKDSLACAPTCALSFEEQSEAVKKTIDFIKANEPADIYICLSHSGIWENKEKSEDEILAKAVPELDIILSGHTHSTLEEPIIIGETHIVSCGEYGVKVGDMSLVQKESGRWEVQSYRLIPLTQDIAQNQDVLEKLQKFRLDINDDYLKRFNYRMDQILTYNPFYYSSLEEIENVHEENPLGNLLADAYRYAIAEAEGENGKTVDVSIVPAGVIRSSFTKGDITTADAFEISSLGIGPDQIPGYPLVTIYLTGKELKTIAEIDASVSPGMTSVRLFSSGLNFSFNPNRLPLNRVTDVWLEGEEGKRIELEEDRLYSVVSDLYTGQMLGSVMDVSYGLLSIVPKDEMGRTVNNLEDFIVYQNDMELKAWKAIADYLVSFEEQGGAIPQYYGGIHGRKVVENSKALPDLIKNPNMVTVLVITFLLIILLLMGLVLAYIAEKIRKRVKNRHDEQSNVKKL